MVKSLSTTDALRRQKTAGIGHLLLGLQKTAWLGRTLPRIQTWTIYTGRKCWIRSVSARTGRAAWPAIIRSNSIYDSALCCIHITEILRRGINIALRLRQIAPAHRIGGLNLPEPA